MGDFELLYEYAPVYSTKNQLQGAVVIQGSADIKRLGSLDDQASLLESCTTTSWPPDPCSNELDQSQKVKEAIRSWEFSLFRLYALPS